MGYGPAVVVGLMWGTGAMSVATDHHKDLASLMVGSVCYGAIVASVGLAGVGSLEKEVIELAQQFESTKSGE